MPWVIVYAAVLATAGLLVLGWLAFRVWLEVRRLAREVDAAGRRMARAAGDLGDAVAPLVERAGGAPVASAGTAGEA